MATIMLIVIGVISLLVKQNKLTFEVFCWLAVGREHSMFFFPPKKPKMSAGRWCCVSFWFWQEIIGFGFTYLCTKITIQLWCCVSFWFWREIVFGVTYILSVQYSCAVVSVFWLWREIDLKMRTPFEFLLGYFIMICQPMCIS